MKFPDETPSYITAHAPKIDTPKVSSRLCPVSVQNLTRIAKETTSDQLDTPDVTTADAAREAVKQAIFEMSIVGAPVQSTASAVSGTEPNSLVDWISSFLKTLKQFNDIVDKIATASIILYPASPVNAHPMSRSILMCKRHGVSSLVFPRSAVELWWSHNLIYELQIIIDQKNRDDSVCALVSKMDEAYAFLTVRGLNDIVSMGTIVERITRQTVECSYFIQAYCGNQKFRKLT